jgi:hypothetical protein
MTKIAKKLVVGRYKKGNGVGLMRNEKIKSFGYKWITS